MADKAAALGCSSYWKHWDKPLQAEIPMAAKCSFPDLALWELRLLSVPWMRSGDTVEASLMCFVLFFYNLKTFSSWRSLIGYSSDNQFLVLPKLYFWDFYIFFSTLLPICLFFCRLTPPSPRYVTVYVCAEHSRAANSFWGCFAWKVLCKASAALDAIPVL